VQGNFLTPDQISNMLRLGVLNREFIWQQGWEKSRSEKLANRLPAMDKSLPRIPGIHFLGEDVNLKQGGKARVVEVHPDGSIEVKAY
jgi:hypothetical protein